MFRRIFNMFGVGDSLTPAPLPRGEGDGRSDRRTKLAQVTSTVNDVAGWSSMTGRIQDYGLSEMQEIYADALTAWRKNPIAWRIIAVTSDYVVGDGIRIGSPNRSLNKFVNDFWNHPQNRMDLRLEGMSDELARSGDLFVLLFRNPLDGLSYIRFVTKDRIVKIETAPNDWERELTYFELLPDSSEPRPWISPDHPEAHKSEAVMLHYAVNKPVGALLGESDLTTMLPWLQRYSRMLEDRVRLHWALRAFLWFVTVPSNMVSAKKEQYRNPPEAGSIIVKDESEHWEVSAPSLQGGDASHDMKAVRGMIDAGSGYPPHWRGEAGDANLATAQAMQGPTERHLLRRQEYFGYILEDILFHAYERSRQAGMSRALACSDYKKIFSIVLPDVSRWDNEALARSAAALANALASVAAELPGKSAKFTRYILENVAKFTGWPLDDEELDSILEEAASNPRPAPVVNPALTPDPSPNGGGEKTPAAGDKGPQPGGGK